MALPPQALVALLVLAAGCVSAPAPAVAPAAAPFVATLAPASFPDAAGDAVDPPASPLLCAALCELLAPTSAPAPYFDLLGFHLEETEDAVRIALELASLTEGFPELDAGGVHRKASYEVCWTPGADSGERCASLEVASYGGAAETAANFLLRAAACNEWAACAWEIPATVEYGAPGRIVLDVPKGYATWDGAPPRIGEAYAYVWWYAFNPASPAWHTALSINTGGDDFHRHASGGEATHVADVTDTVAPAATFAPSPATPPPAAGPVMELASGNFLGHAAAFDRPELDLLAVDVGTEDGQLVATWTVREMRALPDFHFLFILEVGTAGKEVWELGFLRETQGAYGYAGHCISYECAGDLGGDHEEHDMSTQFSDVVDHEVVLGAPATITVRAPIAMFPSLAEGDTTNLLLAVSMFTDADVWLGRYGDEARADWHKMSFVDYRFGGAPRVFDEGNAEPAEPHGH